MLINTIKSMDVVSIKLTSGEEVMGSFLEKNDKTLKLRKPLALVLTQQGPSLSPYFMTSDVMKDNVEIEFNMQNVTAMIKTQADFANAYTEATSGISMSSVGDMNKLKI